MAKALQVINVHEKADVSDLREGAFRGIGVWAWDMCHDMRDGSPGKNGDSLKT